MEKNFLLLNSAMSSIVNELYAESTLTQTYKNNNKNPLEVKLVLPLSKESILHKLTIQFEDKTVYARIIEKEKAKEMHTDSISSGNLSITGNYSEDNEELYELNIGNIPPEKQFTIITTIIQLIQSENQQYCFTVSPGVFPSINSFPKEQSLIVTINTSTGPISSVTSNKNHVCTGNVLTFSDISQNQFKIYFTTPYHNAIQLFEEYDNVKDIYAYTLHYYHHRRQNIDSNSKDKSKEINDTPGVFYFLIDQSGSMSGMNIELAKKALLLFLQSLPLGSYFYIMGFGSNCVAYTNKPLLYNEDNLEKSMIIETIESLQANLGGTNLLEPLSKVYKANPELKLSKSIFILTDGAVSNANDCFDLVSSHRNEFRVHAIGIGDSFDEKFVEKIGIIGKGTSSFVTDLKKLNVNVVDALNKALRPYLRDVSILIEGDKMIEYPQMNTNNVVYEDEFYNYSFITKNQLKSNAEVSFNAFDPIKLIDIKESKSLLITQLSQGNALNQTIVGQYLKDGKNIISKEDMLKLSIEYQVLSDATTLIGEVELNEKSNQVMEVIHYTCQKIDNSNLCKGINQQQYIYGRAAMRTKNDKATNFTFGRPRLIGSYSGDMNLCKGISIKRKKGKSPKRHRDRDRDRDCDRDKDRDRDCDSVDEIRNERIRNIKGTDTAGTYDKIIRSQNMFDGSWNENKDTEFLMKIMKDNYEKLLILIKKDNNTDENIMRKIIFTYLVIRFINEQHNDKIQETRLIIHKAKTYLLNNYSSYEDISNALLI